MVLRNGDVLRSVVFAYIVAQGIQVTMDGVWYVPEQRRKCKRMFTIQVAIEVDQKSIVTYVSRDAGSSENASYSRLAPPSAQNRYEAEV